MIATSWLYQAALIIEALEFSNCGQTKGKQLSFRVYNIFSLSLLTELSFWAKSLKFTVS